MDQRTKRDIESAGAWFVGAYSQELYTSYQRIQNEPLYKKEKIQRIFDETGRDSRIGGTKTRVNSILKIIARGDLQEALRYVINSRISQGNDAIYAKQAQEFLDVLAR